MKYIKYCSQKKKKKNIKCTLDECVMYGIKVILGNKNDVLVITSRPLFKFLYFYQKQKKEGEFLESQESYDLSQPPPSLSPNVFREKKDKCFGDGNRIYIIHSQYKIGQDKVR